MIKFIANLYNKYKELINYSIFGALTAIINLGLKWLLLFTIFDQTNSIELQASIIISWIVAVLFAYFTNRRYVFESKNKNILKEFIGFILARISTLFLEMIIMWFFITLLKLNSNTYVIIFTLLAQVCVIVGNYIFSKLFIFNKIKQEK